MQREFLIDVSRLLWRLLKGRHPTGVGRVCREYLKYYGDHARSLVQIGGSGFILNQGVSRRLFETLIDAPSRPNAKIAAGLLARGLAVSGIPVIAPGTVLINPGHTGLESQRYARFLCKRELTALFVVHDLIPLTHPEFCRPGTRKKHLARMKCVLEIGAWRRYKLAGHAGRLVGLCRAARRPASAFCTRPCSVRAWGEMKWGRE
jgi:hypothetical protein